MAKLRQYSRGVVSCPQVTCLITSKLRKKQSDHKRAEAARPSHEVEWAVLRVQKRKIVSKAKLSTQKGRRTAMRGNSYATPRTV